MWFYHLLHLLGRSWVTMTSATSTNTLGFILWTLLFAVVGWAAQIVTAWVTLARAGDPTPLRTALAQTKLAFVSWAIGTAGVVFVAWSVFVVVVIYQDHHAVTTDNNALRLRVSELSNKPAECWLYNLGMKPPSSAPAGTRSGNYIVFFCDADYEAPLTVRWDFTSPPTRLGIPVFPDSGAAQVNFLSYGDHAVAFVQMPSLLKFQPTVLEIYSFEELCPQVFKVTITPLVKTGIPVAVVVTARDLRHPR